MLADENEPKVQSGGLDQTLYLPAEWKFNLLDFIAHELPKWRDDPARVAEMGEASLTSRLCAHMNSATRKSNGWDFLQFRVEEPDEEVGGRKLDLVPAPSAVTICIEGREYTHYTPLLPIECKRLPIPNSAGRDEREYLHSAKSSTGGVQRFKAGHHGAAHDRAAMIGYIQANDIDFWEKQMGDWVRDLVADNINGWSATDTLQLRTKDLTKRTAALKSIHTRDRGLPDMHIHHLWIEM